MKHPALDQIRAFKAQRFTCYACGRSEGWWVTWEDAFGKGDCCERCGCTAVDVREGRPIGRRSKDWATAVEAYKMAIEVDFPLEWVLDGLVLRRSGWARR